MTSRDTTRFLAACADIVGPEQVIVQPEPLLRYKLDGQVPKIVARPGTPEEARGLVAWAVQERLPITPRGAGTQIDWGPPLGRVGLMIDTTRLARVVDFAPANLSVVVEAGISHAALQAAVGQERLRFPVQSATNERATLGGLVATNASGSQRLGYRGVRDWLLGLRAVTPEAASVRFGGQVTKNVAGYDVTKLYIGSWGTLGLLTELTLRLLPLPETRRALLVPCPNPETAERILLALVNSVLNPTALDLLDAAAAAATGLDLLADLAESEVVLLVGFEGFREATRRQIRDGEALARAQGALDVFALAEAEEAGLWAARAELEPKLLAVEAEALRVKLCVPRGRAGAAVRAAWAAAHGDGEPLAQLAVTGHAGSGVFYVTLWPRPTEFDLGNTWPKAAGRALAELDRQAQALGGFALLEAGPAHLRATLRLVPPRSDYQLMRGIRQQIDPRGLFNAGKLVGVDF